MKTNRRLLSRFLFALSLFFLFSYSVQAETTECTVITSLPYTITTQGIYCLTSDLSTGMGTGNAITIATNNVVIDLNGHKLGGLAAGPGTGARGIYANQRKNITIRNGTIRGFMEGIWLSDGSPYTTSQGHLIEDIRANMNTSTGIHVDGQGNIIRNNQVVSTSGSTGAIGIMTVGPGARVLNNDVIETKEQTINTSAWGVLVHSGPGSVVENNRIGNSSLGPGASCGIYIYFPGNVLVSDNRVTNMKNGVSYISSATGKYHDNLTSGVTTPFSGGTDAGGND
jgi:hypothetical protein